MFDSFRDSGSNDFAPRKSLASAPRPIDPMPVSTTPSPSRTGTGQLHGRTILITGGADGIGWECVQAYAAEGARVAVLDRHAERLAEVANLLGPDHCTVLADVAEDAQVAAAVTTVLERFGHLDAVHNNAGIASPSKPLHLTTDAEFDRIVRVNLASVLYTARHTFAALCASRGSILCTSSLVGEIGQADHAAYAASKGGINALVKSMALDYAPLGIRVNAVSPAGVWTPMLRRWCTEQTDPAGIERYLDLIHPLGYCPEGDVIADAAVFLLSDRARFITGTILPVSGGAELGYRRS